MKKRALFLALLLCAALAGTTAAQKKGARDLYIEGPGGSGMSGAKVTVELKRNGRTSYVSPDYAFQSGDRIRLIFDLNFQGYVTILNVGSSGRTQLLYPYQGVSNRVSPNAATKIPQNDWIRFDNQPGTEQLTVIFSSAAIPEVQQYESLVAQEPTTSRPPSNGPVVTQPSAPAGGNVSTGGVATSDEAQQILAELNSRSLKRGRAAKGRDLFIETGSDGAYCVANNSQITQPIAFTINLAHN